METVEPALGGAEEDPEVETAAAAGVGAERLMESFSGRVECDEDWREAKEAETDAEADTEAEEETEEETREIPTVLKRRLITGFDVSMNEPKESRSPSEERRDRSDRFSASNDSIFFCE